MTTAGLHGSQFRALGVDVGVKKGLDLVLLDERWIVLEVRSHVPTAELPSLIADLRPNAIAIDSPPRFPEGVPRRTEVEIRKRGISLYQTPWQHEKQRSKFYDWMREGFKAFEASRAAGFELFRGERFDGLAFEVFPYAVAVILSGGLRPRSMTKQIWRRGILTSQRIDMSGLKNVDQVDAALAALTGVLALQGNVCWEGDPSEGVIVLPCRAADLKDRYFQPRAR